jgi:hypothetical protein
VHSTECRCTRRHGFYAFFFGRATAMAAALPFPLVRTSSRDPRNGVVSRPSSSTGSSRRRRVRVAHRDPRGGCAGACPRRPFLSCCPVSFKPLSAASPPEHPRTGSSRAGRPLPPVRTPLLFSFVAPSQHSATDAGACAVPGSLSVMAGSRIE